MDHDERLARAVEAARHTAMVEAGRGATMVNPEDGAQQAGATHPDAYGRLLREAARLRDERAALRAALSQAEAERTQADTYIGEMAETLARLTAERTSLRQIITDLLGSADCAWEESGGGHDWPEAVAAARTALGVRDGKE